MIPMEATMRQKYNGKSLSAGDPFTVDNETDAADLVCLKMAVRKKSVVTPAEIPLARDMKAADLGESDSDEDKKAKGQYKRRDMQAARS